MAKKSKKRGCAGLIPLTGLAFGALACAWSFYLGQTSGGDQVSIGTGITFYLGWLCGMTMIGISVLVAILQSILGTAGKAAGNISGKAEGGLGSLIPGGGSLVSLSVLSSIFRNKN